MAKYELTDFNGTFRKATQKVTVVCFFLACLWLFLSPYLLKHRQVALFSFSLNVIKFWLGLWDEGQHHDQLHKIYHSLRVHIDPKSKCFISDRWSIIRCFFSITGQQRTWHVLWHLSHRGCTSLQCSARSLSSVRVSCHRFPPEEPVETWDPRLQRKHRTGSGGAPLPAEDNDIISSIAHYPSHKIQVPGVR